MADDNKPMKYIRYAIGEIMLVVIGILIALQINNWNENRRHVSTINSVYSIVKSDLLSDIESIDDVLNKMSPKEILFKRVINKEMTAEYYKKCEDCRIILSGFPDISLKKRGFKLLEENSTIFDSNLDSLSIKINDFYSYHNIEIKVATEEITVDFKDNYNFYKNNKSWFTDYYNNVKNEEFIIYALTSSDYRNRATSFHLLYFKIYLKHLKEYKKNALRIINDIEKQIK